MSILIGNSKKDVSYLKGILKRLFTKNLRKIPLFWVDFNYRNYIENGKENSCMLNIHPNLAKDEFVKKALEDLADYIRDNYDMNEI